MKEGVILGEKEDRLRGDCLFEGIKGILLWCFLMPCAVLNGEVKQQMHMMQEVLNEALVEVGEA